MPGVGFGKVVRCSRRRLLGCIPLNPNVAAPGWLGWPGTDAVPRARLEAGVTSASDPLGLEAPGLIPVPARGWAWFFVPCRRDEAEGKSAARKCQPLQGFFLAKWLPRERVLRQAEC